MRKHILLAEMYGLQTILLEGRMDFIITKYASALGGNRALVQQFAGSPSSPPEEVGKEMIDNISRFDPDKAKKYTQWLVELILKRDIRFEDLPNVQEVLAKFNQIKARMPQEQRDIQRFKTMADLESALAPFGLQKSNKEVKRDNEKEMYAQAEMVLNTATYRIIIPKTKEASCYFGVNTRWCTAAENYNRFENYNRDGPLYIILDKKNNERYQFHFSTLQFMDEQDHELDLESFKRKHPEVVKFFDKEKMSFGKFKNIRDFVEDKGDDTAKWIMKISEGGDTLDFNPNDAYLDKYKKKEFLDGLGAERLMQLGKWLQENYTDDIEENDLEYDPSSAESILELQNIVEDDEFTDAFRFAAMAGEEVGAENEMHKALVSAINRVPHLQYLENGEWLEGKDWNWDSPFRCEMTFPQAIDALDGDDISELGDKIKVEVEEPRYGFQGYDEEVAKERFGELIHELLP